MEADIRAAREREEAAIAHRENADPTGLLASDDLDRANAHRPFANDQADVLDVGDLSARLDSVLADGDGPGVTFAWWMAGLRRRARILDARRRAVATATELDAVLDRMHAALDRGRTAAAVEAARGRLRELEEAERAAYLARHETSSVYNPTYSVPSR